jgi:aspartyl-tRNA(Asn)/glutamyl-tRNA(Gln) amidotransferase subunit A
VQKQTDLWARSATALAADVRERRASSEEIVRTVLARIEALDVLTNAFAFVDHEGALNAAREADRAVAEGRPLGPLHGLPVTAKDVIATAGMRTAYGSRLYKDNVPQADPEAIARVRRAGGILIGKTTSPEFAHKILTDSPLHGITRNPWSLEHSCGGSSGGAGAAAAMGFGALHVTTDGGGSSRVPASCCGVVGLKPTQGAVPNETTQDLFGLQVLGVIAREVCDVRLLYDTMAGPFPDDPYAAGIERQDTTLPADPLAILSGLRVRWFPLMGNRRVDPEVAALTRSAVDRLAGAGAKVFEAGDIDWATDAWRVYMRAQQAHRFGPILEKIRGELDPSMVDCIEEGLEQTSGELREAVMERSAFFRRLTSVFRGADIFASPVVSAPPLRAEHKASEPLEIQGEVVGPLRAHWYNYVIPINGSGNPAMSLPCGRTRGGLPVGLQIVAPWRAEPLLLKVAAALEALQPWAQDWPATARSA